MTRFGNILAGIAIIATAMLISAPAIALSRTLACSPYERMTNHITKKYGELNKAVGIASGGKATVEFWHSDKANTFTILIILPSPKMACIVAAGRDWQAAPKTPSKEPKT